MPASTPFCHQDFFFMELTANYVPKRYFCCHSLLFSSGVSFGAIFTFCMFRYNMSLVMRKPVFAYAKTKTQISFAVTAKLISAFVFATRRVQSLNFLYTKFQASSHFVWSCSLVCVGPGRKPRRPVFSQRGSYLLLLSEPRKPDFCTCEYKDPDQLRSNSASLFSLYR